MKTMKSLQSNKNNADIYAKDDDGITCYGSKKSEKMM